MDVRQILARYALEPSAVELLQDAWRALEDAEMVETMATLRTRVFGSGRCLSFDQDQRAYILRPFVELLVRALRDIADDGRFSVSTLERKARVILWEAGF